MKGRMISSVLALCVVLVMAGHGESSPKTVKIFDGQQKVIVVNGYSTSLHWPEILQAKLDEYFGGERKLVVKKAVKGGTPVAKWMDVKTGGPLRPWRDILKPALQNNGDAPVIVLAQQSLQWAFGAREEAIRNADDTDRIRQGADVLQKYAVLLNKDGADLVFVATHIYKHAMEPGIGNERYALDELMRRDVPFIRRGPDVWTRTKKLYPVGFARDEAHPNAKGAAVIAQAWFESLLKHDGLEVPVWSQRRDRTPARSGRGRGGATNFASQGVQLGEKFPELTTYTPEGKSREPGALWGGMPALLITASLTCPVSRRTHDEFEAIAKNFEGRIRVALIYTIESHPVEDPSPYSGQEWVTQGNVREGIVRRQPTSLEARLQLARDYKERLKVTVPILVDGMENLVWKNLGAGPNMGVLIRSDGTVEAKQSWFKAPDMIRAIDELLGSDD